MENRYTIIREQITKNITDHFDIIEKHYRTKRSEVEKVLFELLNFLNNWSLSPHNDDDLLFPVIELSDKALRIAAKITYSADPEDFFRTLKQFGKRKLHKRFNQLIFLVISDHELDYDVEKLPHIPWFSAESCIWDIPRIKATIQNESNLVLLEKICGYLDAEIRRFSTSDNLPSPLLPPPPRPSSSFLPGSRDSELEQLVNHMKQKKLLFLYGSAGIGKTELAIQLASHFDAPRGSYFLRFKQPRDVNDASMIETILNANFDGCDFQFSEDRYTAYQERLSLLQEKYTNTLLIIDGLDCPNRTLSDLINDPSYTDLIELRNYGIHLVFTTRSILKGIGFEVQPLSSEILLRLIRNTYPDNSTTDDHLIELLHAVEYNTLVVNFIDQILQSGNGQTTPWQIMETLIKSNLTLHDFTNVISEQNRSFKVDSFANQLLNLLDIASLEDDAISILMFASLLPETGIKDQFFCNAIPSGNQKTLQYLFDASWLRIRNKIVSIPSLVRHVCLNDNRYRPDYLDFLNNLWNTIEIHNCNEETAEQLAICFSSVVDRQMDREGLCAMRAARLWSLAGNEDKALKYSIHSLLIKEDNLSSDHPDTLTTYIDAASILISQGKYHKALEYNLHVLEVLKKTLPINHLDLSSAYIKTGISLSYDSIGRYMEALDYLLYGLSVLEKELPENHQDIPIVYFHIGNLFIKLDDYPFALAYQKTAHHLLEESYPKDDKLKNKILSSIQKITSYLTWKENHRNLLQTQISSSNEVLLSDPLELVNAYSKIVECSIDLDDYSTAMENYHLALEIYKKLPKEKRYKTNFHPSMISRIDQKKDIQEKAQSQSMSLTIPSPN